MPVQVKAPAAAKAREDEVQRQMLQAVAGGSERAVRECVDQFGGLVWSLALRHSPDRYEAEDATQEIFADLWRSAGRYEPAKASPAGFVAMIARRRLIDRQRRADRRPQLVAMPEGLEPRSEDHETMDRRIDARRALEALEVLKPDQRRFIELSLVSGLSHAEIASETGAPLGTVKSGIRRGLAAARSALEGTRWT